MSQVAACGGCGFTVHADAIDDLLDALNAHTKRHPEHDQFAYSPAP